MAWKRSGVRFSLAPHQRPRSHDLGLFRFRAFSLDGAEILRVRPITCAASGSRFGRWCSGVTGAVSSMAYSTTRWTGWTAGDSATCPGADSTTWLPCRPDSFTSPRTARAGEPVIAEPREVLPRGRNVSAWNTLGCIHLDQQVVALKLQVDRMINVQRAPRRMRRPAGEWSGELKPAGPGTDRALSI